MAKGEPGTGTNPAELRRQIEEMRRDTEEKRKKVVETAIAELRRRGESEAEIQKLLSQTARKAKRRR